MGRTSNDLPANRSGFLSSLIFLAKAKFTRQVLSFGVVGFGGVVVNVAVFNFLRVLVFPPDRVALGPMFSVILATAAAIIFNWVGNRFWVFRASRQQNTLREMAEFFSISILGAFIPLVCLVISHYVLGFTTLWADNIATNVLGLALGTTFRFLGYRFWVYSPKRKVAVVLERGEKTRQARDRCKARIETFTSELRTSREP